ncbi:MAG TPA: response regulator [Gaiellaceae bacterium]|nr:response regulator [Gaiellaceae bacterium]
MTSPRVLVVDDDARNRKLVRDVLHASGVAVLEAETGAAAVGLAREHRPDVVLMDVRLPDLDGDAVLRLLAADPVTADIPVVALTALSGARAALLAAGFAGYLEKPIDVLELPDQVRRFATR